MRRRSLCAWLLGAARPARPLAPSRPPAAAAWAPDPGDLILEAERDPFVPAHVVLNLRESGYKAQNAQVSMVEQITGRVNINRSRRISSRHGVNF